MPHRGYSNGMAGEPLYCCIETNTTCFTLKMYDVHRSTGRPNVMLIEKKPANIVAVRLRAHVPCNRFGDKCRDPYGIFGILRVIRKIAIFSTYTSIVRRRLFYSTLSTKTLPKLSLPPRNRSV